MKKIVSLVLMLFVSSFVYAAPPKQDKANMPPEPPQKQQDHLRQDFDKISKELNITDEQKQKINELMQSDLAKKKVLRDQIRQKSELIDEELIKEKFDMNVINNLSTEIQQLNAEISKINIESKLNVRNILTFDQYSRMEQARKQMMEKFKQAKLNKQDNTPSKIPSQKKMPQKTKK